MFVSSKNNFNINKSLNDDLSLSKNEKRENSLEKSKNYLNLKKKFYKKETKIEPEKKINKNLSILNFIQNKSEGRASVKTYLSDSIPEKFDYDLHMIIKYNENLDTSLSFISEFDLEKDDTKQNDSFNSCDNDDDSIEEIEIKTKSNANKRISYDNIYRKNEIDLDFEKDWNDIKELILNKKGQQTCI